MLSFACPQCQSWISVDEIEHGKPVTCPECHAEVEPPDALPPVRVPPLARIAEPDPEPETAVPPLSQDLPPAEWVAGPATSPPQVEEPVAPGEQRAGASARDPGVAAALSLMPGLGHWYCGRFGRGLAYLFFQIAIIAMSVVAWQNVQLEKGYFGKYGLLVIGICSFIAIELLGMYDASRCARQRNRMFLLE